MALRSVHEESELFINSVPSTLIGTEADDRINRWNLAAGIAHQINTPEQFVGDNATFQGNVACHRRNLAGMLTAAAEVAAGPYAPNTIAKLLQCALARVQHFFSGCLWSNLNLRRRPQQRRKPSDAG
jgi:hypothetical protein